MNTQGSMLGIVSTFNKDQSAFSGARSSVGRFAKYGVIAAVAALAGCASYPAPVQRMASSEAAIRGAQEVGSSNDPQAQLHLKLAQEQLTQAKALMNDGDNKRADYLLLRADADAELAIALSREVSTRSAAEQATSQVQSLKKSPQ